MLIKNIPALKEEEIIGLKLLTGEEIVCRVSSFNDTEVAVHMPLHLVQAGDGNMAWAPIVNMGREKREFVLYRTSIVGHFELEEQFEKAYMEATSEILVPSKKIIA